STLSVPPPLSLLSHVVVFFYFNDPPTTEIYTLSLHDALPISARTAVITRQQAAALRYEASLARVVTAPATACRGAQLAGDCSLTDRKSTRLNSSHVKISYAVFCLKKKKKKDKHLHHNTEAITQ